MSPDDSDSTNRRNVLKTVGAGALATLGAGAASADVPDPSEVDDAALREREAAFDDADSIRAAVDEYAGAVLAELVDRGVLDTASAAAFDPGRVHDEAYADEVIGVHTRDGPTAHIHLRRETPDATVDLYVRPGEDFAEVNVRESEESGFRVESTDGDVTVQSNCWTDGYTCYDNRPCISQEGCIQTRTVCCSPGSSGGHCCGSERAGCCGCF